jgi:hypothetical protein
MFKFKMRTPEDQLKSARIRERMGKLLKDHYWACARQELPPRLLATLKKLEEERPELSRSLKQSHFGSSA